MRRTIGLEIRETLPSNLPDYERNYPNDRDATRNGQSDDGAGSDGGRRVVGLVAGVRVRRACFSAARSELNH